ncbi:MAG: hypothetical protein AAB606_01315 [Patescibacteria group bacterium]
MKYFPKISPLWWTQNIRYLVYFLRELTGVFIAFYIISFLVLAFNDPHLAFTLTPFFKIVSVIGLMAAVFHSLTWLWVMPRLIADKLIMRILLYVLLLGITVTVSLLLLKNFYE